MNIDGKIVKRVRETLKDKNNVEKMAELLYKEGMRSEGWTDIVPFKEISKEYQEDILSLAKRLIEAIDCEC